MSGTTVLDFYTVSASAEVDTEVIFYFRVPLVAVGNYPAVVPLRRFYRMLPHVVVHPPVTTMRAVVPHQAAVVPQPLVVVPRRGAVVPQGTG